MIHQQVGELFPRVNPLKTFALIDTDLAKKNIKWANFNFDDPGHTHRQWEFCVWKREGPPVRADYGALNQQNRLAGVAVFHINSENVKTTTKNTKNSLKSSATTGGMYV